jgi:hypothetical protein
VQDRVGDRHLADVVELGRADDVVVRGLVEAQRARQPAGERGDGERVLVQRAVVLCDGPQQALALGRAGRARGRAARRTAQQQRWDEAQRGYGASPIRNLRVIPCTHGH